MQPTLPFILVDESPMVPHLTQHMTRGDSDIWEAVLAGDGASWRELIRRYQALVNTVAIRAGLSMADAADCFQQTWVALYEHRHKLNDPNRLSAWLVTSARREAIRLSRLARRELDESAAGDPPDSRALPDELLMQLERQAYLETAMQRLGERCRHLIDLLFFSPEDWSYERIAEKLGIAFNSLGPVRKRCLEQLSKILREIGLPDVREPA